MREDKRLMVVQGEAHAAGGGALKKHSREYALGERMWGKAAFRGRQTGSPRALEDSRG